MALIPAERLTDWTPGTYTGVPGGIPTRTNLIDVTQAPYNADNTGATDAGQAIVDALAAASSGDVVYAPDGDYRLETFVQLARSNVSLRGAGISRTRFIPSHANGNAFKMGIGHNWDWPTNGVQATAGISKGSTSVTVTDATEFSVGKMALLVFSNDDTVLPVVSSRGYRKVRQQLVNVTAKAGNTLTIFPPLYSDYSGSATCTLYTAQTVIQLSGIENLTLDCTDFGGSVGIKLEGIQSCWVDGVKIIKGRSFPFEIADCLQYEIRQSVVYESGSTGSPGFAGARISRSCAGLIEDNIFYQSFPHIEMNAASSGNMVAYNFLWDIVGGSGGSLNVNHDPHNSYNLFEGNLTPTAISDGYSGGSSEDTFLRNWIHGADPSGDIGFGLLLKRFTRNTNIVGNVLRSGISYGQPNINNPSTSGTAQFSLGDPWTDFLGSGTLTTRSSATTGTITLNSPAVPVTGRPQIFIFWDGMTQDRVQLSDVVASGQTFTFTSPDTLPPEGTAIRYGAGPEGFQELDLDVEATAIDKGNYFADTDTTSSLGGDTLPDSLAYASEPSWWPSGFGWPPIDPASPPATADQATMEAILPAAYRYYNGAIETPPTTVRTFVIGGKRLVIGGKILAFPDAVTATADFDFSPAYPAEGELLNFSYTGTGGTTFDWKSNGVTFSTDENPTGINLGSADTYTIELTVDGGATHSESVTVFPVGSVDSDAAAFATRHGSLTDAQFAAVNAAVLQVKDAGLWTAIKAWWPIIGGTETLHEYNAKGSTFDLVISDATNKLTHSSNGILRNDVFGPSIATGITPSTHLSSINSITVLAYSRTNNTSLDVPIFYVVNGAVNSKIALGLASAGNPSICIGGTADVTAGATTRTGVFIGTRTSSTSIKLYRRDSLTTTTIASSATANTGAIPDAEMLFMTQSGQACANQICAGMVLNAGVTDAEAEVLGRIVEDMQAALGRSAFANNADEQNFIDGIDNLLDGTDDVAVYSGAGVRNTGCWFPDATWVPYGGNNGVPITPRHMLFVGHYLPTNGSTITFYAADNTLVTRTVSTSTIVSGMPSGTQGVYVVKLSADLPGTITIPKLAPSNLDTLCRVPLLPAVSVHRGTQAYVGVCQWTDTTKTQLFLTKPSDATRAAVFAQATGGASGSWAGLRAADTGEPVTLFVTENGFDSPSLMSAGTYVGAYLSAITAAVDATGNEGHSISVWS